MFAKLILSSAYDFNDVPCALVPLHSHGVDGTFMQKRASRQMFAKELAELKPDPKLAYVHVLAVGDEEAYGDNRNGDAFSEQDNRTAHVRFKKQGHVFKNHKNFSPELATGEVAATGHNDDMHRIELIIGLEKAKYAEELAAFEKGKDIPVSMGCFTAGHLVTMENGTTRLLESLKVGDQVVTHLGNHSAVIETMARPYEGKLYRLTAKTIKPIECTPNHPFFVLRRKHVFLADGRHRREPGNINLGLADWVRAEDLEVGDYLLTPDSSPRFVDDELTVPILRLLGYYCAEGHVRLTPCNRFCSIILSVASSDAAVSEVPKLCEQLGFPCTIRDSTSSVKAKSITISSPYLAYLCEKHCGRYAKTKQLSYELMTLVPDLQKEFLGAYINGDGCQTCGDWQPGSITISTASETLRDQVVQILHRIGAISGYNKITHQAGSGFSAYKTVEFQLYIARSDVNLLSGCCAKAAPQEMIRQRGGSRMRVDGYVLTPINEVEVRETEGPETVYNLEVEPDNSYLISGVAVHNSMQAYDVCSRCGRRAPTAKEHCDHIKHALCEVGEDGIKNYMKNPDPGYFDISTVWKPADRIGYALRKVAGFNGAVGGHELADQMGLRGWHTTKTAVLMRLAEMEKRVAAIGRIVGNAKTAPTKLSDQTVAQLKTAVARHGVQSVLGRLHKAGHLLGFDDFVEIVVQKPKLAGWSAPVLADGFNKLAADTTEIESLDGDDQNVGIWLGDAAENELEKAAGMRAQSVQSRTLRNSLIVTPAIKTAALADEIEQDGLTALYLHYKLAFAYHERNRHNADTLRAVALSNY